MKIYKFLLFLIALMSTSIGISAQSSFMLWGYCDSPKSVVSFTFILDKGGAPFGIILTEGFNIESFNLESENPLKFICKSNPAKSIKVLPEEMQAVIKYPDRTKRRFRLQEPPYALIQSLQNSSTNNAPVNNNNHSSNTCSLCNGKGWIAGTSTPVYSANKSYYCKECGRDVPASHSHDICPSCNGKGVR